MENSMDKTSVKETKENFSMNNKQKQPAENPARDKKSAAQNAERDPAKQKTIKRLLSYAGKRRGLLSLSLVLSALSALVGFVPYIMVFFVMRDVISAIAAKEAVNAAALAHYGLWAVGSAAVGFLPDDRSACRTSRRLACHA